MSTQPMNWWIPAKLRKARRADKEQVASAPPHQSAADAVWGTAPAEDAEAFTLLYRQHAPAIYRFVLASSASRETAEEVTQETFLFLLNEWRRYDPTRGPLEAWLLGVARQLLRRVWRGERSPAPLQNLRDDPVYPEQGVLHGLLEEEQQQQLRIAIARLPEVYREALVLHALEGHSYAEVALLLDCAVGTVRSRIARAKELLTRTLMEAVKSHGPPRDPILVERSLSAHHEQNRRKGGSDAERNVAAEV